MLNYVTSIPRNGQPEEGQAGSEHYLTVVDLLKSVLNFKDPRREVPNSVDDMRKRIKILDALEEVGDDQEIELGAQQWTFLQGLFSNHPWAVVLRDIVRIDDALLEKVNGKKRES